MPGVFEYPNGSVVPSPEATFNFLVFPLTVGQTWEVIPNSGIIIATVVKKDEYLTITDANTGVTNNYYCYHVSYRTGVGLFRFIYPDQDIYLSENVGMVEIRSYDGATTAESYLMRKDF